MHILTGNGTGLVTLGGAISGSSLASAYAYDTKTDTWATLTLCV